jgi:hypothetical protein
MISDLGPLEAFELVCLIPRYPRDVRYLDDVSAAYEECEHVNAITLLRVQRADDDLSLWLGHGNFLLGWLQCFCGVPNPLETFLFTSDLRLVTKKTEQLGRTPTASFPMGQQQPLNFAVGGFCSSISWGLGWFAKVPFDRIVYVRRWREVPTQDLDKVA